ncbi:MAG TPA: hypothetical protein VJ372_12845 [Pyrinomonadaceae bacterium]|jgi:hypothetical protein|nr:hypothetical protein [Pyrinomonadaceae bacterium]
MRRACFSLCLVLTVGVGLAFVVRRQSAAMAYAQTQGDDRLARIPQPQGRFDLEVLVDGRPLAEYFARGRTYVEALKGAEYELRIRNPTPNRVAVALSVDGLNTIDARHTSAWNSSKWVIDPYQTIIIGGWQMSTERARRFYFTDERDSYGAKLGQTTNLGLLSAVVFRERQQPVSINPPRPIYRDREKSQNEPSNQSADAPAGESGRKAGIARTDDDYAATGIGRSVRNDVRWIDMELEAQPLAELSVRYEYYPALLKLGIFPRPNYEPYPLRRREDSRGFSPEP